MPVPALTELTTTNKTAVHLACTMCAQRVHRNDAMLGFEHLDKAFQLRVRDIHAI